MTESLKLLFRKSNLLKSKKYKTWMKHSEEKEVLEALEFKNKILILNKFKLIDMSYFYIMQRWFKLTKNNISIYSKIA